MSNETTTVTAVSVEAVNEKLSNLNEVVIKLNDLSKTKTNVSLEIAKEYLSGLVDFIKADMFTKEGKPYSLKAKKSVYARECLDGIEGTQSYTKGVLSTCNSVLDKGISLSNLLKFEVYASYTKLQKLPKARVKSIDFTRVEESLKEVFKEWDKEQQLEKAKRLLNK